MAKIGVSFPRPVRRAALTGVLMIGAFTAFAPSLHAHAATMLAASCSTSGPLQPDNLSLATGSAATTTGPANFDMGGSLTVNGVDGQSVTFVGTGTKNLTVSQTGAFNKVSAAGCQDFGNPGNTTSTGQLNVTTSAGTGSCTFQQYTFTVNGDATDSLNVLLDCAGKDFIVNAGTGSVIATGNGNGAATPELGSGELLATGLVPALGIVLYRRRRQRRAGK